MKGLLFLDNLLSLYKLFIILFFLTPLILGLAIYSSSEVAKLFKKNWFHLFKTTRPPFPFQYYFLIISIYIYNFGWFWSIKMVEMVTFLMMMRDGRMIHKNDTQLKLLATSKCLCWTDTIFTEQNTFIHWWCCYSWQILLCNVAVKHLLETTE